jgi:hypothetical protein
MTPTTPRWPAAADLAAVVRLPAVLSVPGDVLVGAALAGRENGPRAGGPLPAALAIGGAWPVAARLSRRLAVI